MQLRTGTSGEVRGEMPGEVTSIAFGTIDKCGFATP
jgi:hypothetical protein